MTTAATDWESVLGIILRGPAYSNRTIEQSGAIGRTEYRGKRGLELW